LQEGEFIIVKDDPQANDQYCAEVRKVLADRIEVNYYLGSLRLALRAYDCVRVSKIKRNNVNKTNDRNDLRTIARNCHPFV
jgi:hypothetical protein